MGSCLPSRYTWVQPTSPLLQAEEHSQMNMLESSLCSPSRQPSSPPTQPTRPWCAWSQTAGEHPAQGCCSALCSPFPAPQISRAALSVFYLTGRSPIAEAALEGWTPMGGMESSQIHGTSGFGNCRSSWKPFRGWWLLQHCISFAFGIPVDHLAHAVVSFWLTGLLHPPLWVW